MDLETTQLEGWLELLIYFGIPAIGTLVGVLLLWIAWGFTAGRGWIETAFPATVPSQTGQVKVP